MYQAVKVIKITLAFTILAAELFTGFRSAQAVQIGETELELTPFIKGGTIAWDQLEGYGGHKSLIAGGLNANLPLDPFSISLELEGWTVAEGLDDDKGIIPRNGYNITTDAKFFFTIIEGLQGYTYAGVGYQEWNRPNAATIGWTYVGFFNGQLGLGLRHDKGSFQLGINRPFATTTSDDYEAIPRYGFSAEGKIHVAKSFYVGLFYRYEGMAFEFNGKEYPDAKMTQSGLLIEYIF